MSWVFEWMGELEQGEKTKNLEEKEAQRANCNKHKEETERKEEEKLLKPSLRLLKIVR